MLGRRLAPASVVVAVLVATVPISQVAVADPPPLNCVDNAGCITRLEKRGTPSRARQRNTPAPPPVQQCIDPAVCNLAAVRGVPVTPAQAAQEAVSLLPLRGPQIGIAPNPGGKGLVGLPVWLWTAVTPLTWGPMEQTTAVTGLAVITRAQAVQITWDMGDGNQVICAGPGTAYDAHYGNRDSPDCGYRYPHAGVYTITGTTQWMVTWRIVGGGNGVIPTTEQTQTTITIDELQVLTQ